MKNWVLKVHLSHGLAAHDAAEPPRGGGGLTCVFFEKKLGKLRVRWVKWTIILNAIEYLLQMYIELHMYIYIVAAKWCFLFFVCVVSTVLRGEFNQIEGIRVFR